MLFSLGGGGRKRNEEKKVKGKVKFKRYIKAKGAKNKAKRLC
jgi:hypothetical protein